MAIFIDARLFLSAVLFLVLRGISANAPYPERPDDEDVISAEHSLYQDLLGDGKYLKHVRPVRNHNKPIYVKVGMCVMMIEELVERDQIMVMAACVKMVWVDEFLSWNPEYYDNLTWMAISSTALWLPDIAIINSPEPYSLTRKVTNVDLNYKGEIGFFPSGRLATRCNLQITYFPFDWQHCEVRFESWIYPSNFLEIELYPGDSVDLKEYYVNHQWTVTGYRILSEKANYDGKNFSSITFTYTLRRKSSFYFMYFIFPELLLALLQTLSHTLPVEHPGRMTMLTALFIGTSVTHAGIAAHIPKSSDTMSLLQIYMAIMSCNLVFALIITFVMLYTVLRYPNEEPCARAMLAGFFSIVWPTGSRRIERSKRRSYRGNRVADRMRESDETEYLGPKADDLVTPWNQNLYRPPSYSDPPLTSSSIYDTMLAQRKEESAKTANKLADGKIGRNSSGQFSISKFKNSESSSNGKLRSSKVEPEFSYISKSVTKKPTTLVLSSLSSGKRDVVSTAVSTPSTICSSEERQGTYTYGHNSASTTPDEIAHAVGVAATYYSSRQECIDAKSPRSFASSRNRSHKNEAAMFTTDESTDEARRQFKHNQYDNVRFEGERKPSKRKGSFKITPRFSLSAGYTNPGYSLFQHRPSRNFDDDLKRRWLLYCVALDKSIMYANGIWNFSLPIALFWIVPAVHEAMLSSHLDR